MVEPQRDFFLFNVINITTPTPGGNAQLDAYCGISASGFVDNTIAYEVRRVLGRINGGTSQLGTVSGFSWSFSSLRTAGDGCKNVLSIKLFYVKLGETEETETDWFNREFMGTGNAACYPYCPPRLVPAPASPVRRVASAGPITEPLPRHYRLSLATRGPKSFKQLGSSFGGLLQQAVVYLSYDVNASTPYEAVWRDINLPTALGKWTLRVQSIDELYVSEISLFRMTDDEVSAPMIWRCDPWNPNGTNMIEAQDCGCDDSRSLTLRDALLQVEPA